jgi:Rrf2 family iron-sulfur cluster assembly transcriptional regulator
MATFALTEKGQPLRAKDIAEDVGVPTFYLSKILRRLVEAELLNAQKGHGGGFVISKPTSKIKFCHILEAIDGDLTQRKCVFGWDLCSDKTPCVLHNSWKNLSTHFLEWSRETTLADLQKDSAKVEYLNQHLSLREKIRK